MVSTLMLVGFGFVSVMSIISFTMGLIAWIEVKAMQKSTHSIQYIPASQDFEKVTNDLETKLNKDLFEAI